jgi:hypothetical protein
MRCAELDCTKIPNFGLEPKKATHCKQHASKDMIDVKSMRCAELDCSKRPSFGLEPKKATHCKQHASKDMFDVISKRCAHSECSKRPSFGIELKQPTHCKQHASKDMMNVVDKRCAHSECTKIPNFGLEPKKATHCKQHAGKDMIDVKSMRCAELDCDKQPNFGIESKKPTHCKQHACNQMINVVHKRCNTCDTTRINPNYAPNCARCHFYLNPSDPRIRNFKVKEHAFMLPLKEIYPELVLDRVVSGGCSKRRPDGLLDCLTHSIIIEIDEDQHVGYETLCDNRPIVFIRLNPDKYSLDGKTTRGCFNQTKSGNLKTMPTEFGNRFSALQDALEHAIHHGTPSRELTYVKLFYSD